MIESSAAYRKAIVADARRILLKAVIDIIDPDISYGSVTSTGQAWSSLPDQLHDKVFRLDRYATIEQDRWLLDSSFQIFPDSKEEIQGEAGFISSQIAGETGDFPTGFWVEMSFANVSILQACSVYFSDDPADGLPEDFTIEVKQGGVAYYTKAITGNRERSVSLQGFTVNQPDAIRLTITKWNTPHRRVRIPEIIPGIYEIWDGDMIAEFSLKQQGDVSCMSLPYGTCTIRMDNLDRRFEPRNKQGVFQSIEERQGIDISLAVRLEDGTEEAKRLGVFYQYSGGWKTGDNGLTMQWELVDIIGLLQGREFIVPAALPTTLQGWIGELAGQLGPNFSGKYQVDPDYAGLTVSVRTAEDVVGMTCGDLLRYVCMATGTWPRADAETGFLAVEPLWSQGNKILLENLEAYPRMTANEDIAAILFTLNDGADTQYVVSGNATASSETKSVKNPFIKTQQQALEAARLILATYGGNRLEATGRGDMASEIGDVDTVWLDESNAVAARRIQQELSFSGGVLQGCNSVLLQADGSFLYQNREVIAESGLWTAPAGVSNLRVILVGGGSGGSPGQDGDWDAAGTDGADGEGGLVWSGNVSINAQQSFNVTIGQGGAVGQSGGATVFGQFTSAQGSSFPYGYTDVASGDVFARKGITLPLGGSGDGGAGGKGGAQGNRRETTNAEGESRIVVDNYPGDGGDGVAGAAGCVVVYWDK